MKQTVIVGVDVSKLTLDIFIRPSGTALCIDNKFSGFKRFLKIIREQSEVDSVIVVMEHTGKYSSRWEEFLRKHEIKYCKVAALQIKRSMGMVRGKNDKIDAVRISEYGWLRREILTSDEWPGEPIRSLQEWLSLRTKLVSDRSGYICRLKELKSVALNDGVSKELIKIQKNLIAVFNQKIAEADKKIRSIIKENMALSRSWELLKGIKGVGWIVAAYMISCTDNFKRFSNARKFNCYAGLAPFVHQSGSSIRGRARVSHLANKEAKRLLTLAATSAIQHDPEMKTFYTRRVAEGKPRMSCVNMIRVKLVSRMFAVIKRQTPYLPLRIAA